MIRQLSCIIYNPGNYIRCLGVSQALCDLLHSKSKDESEKLLHENNRLLDENIRKEKINIQSDELLKKGREEVQKMYLEFKTQSEEITSTMHQD